MAGQGGSDSHQHRAPPCWAPHSVPLHPGPVHLCTPAEDLLLLQFFLEPVSLFLGSSFTCLSWLGHGYPLTSVMPSGLTLPGSLPCPPDPTSHSVSPPLAPPDHLACPEAVSSTTWTWQLMSLGRSRGAPSHPHQTPGNCVGWGSCRQDHPVPLPLQGPPGGPWPAPQQC